MIKAVLFDFDGTLVCTDRVIFMGYKYLFDTYRPDYHPSEEEYKSFLGPALREVFPKYFKEDIGFLINEYRKHSHEYINDKYVFLHPGVKELLKMLKEKNIARAIITSRQNSSTQELLDILGISDCFEVLVGYDDVIEVKPNPEPFNKALSKLGLTNDEVIMVGDHYADIAGAVNSNIKPVGVNWTSQGADNLKKTGAIAIIKDMRDLLPLIEELNRNDL